MKLLKKVIICMLSVVLLCGGQIVPVSAAEWESAENESEIMPLKVDHHDVTINGVTVQFFFDYSDGSSAKLVGAFCITGGYEMPNPPSSHFSGDTCYATAVVMNSSTHATITFKAWCDIYGQMGTN